jgi:hypothetical protein
VTDDNTIDEPLLDSAAAAAFLTALGHRTSATTLNKKRCTVGGPPFVRLGSLVRYRPSRLRAWAASRTSCELSSTADAPLTGRGRPKTARQPAQPSAAA